MEWRITIIHKIQVNPKICSVQIYHLSPLLRVEIYKVDDADKTGTWQFKTIDLPPSPTEFKVRSKKFKAKGHTI